ncbi:MAG: gliding motility-associated C-terminal domain-containing protein, partial [Spirosomaceae bacterium]|nr:gliding motility-associated C-terminal domain-containing protein [Spirosomataceae bacterium]
TDRDGDELRYSLVTPMSIYGNDIRFPVQSGGRPVIYSEFVEWAPGYSTDNAIPGSPPLRIDPKFGELSVKASQVGLFAFTVLVEEYRNGERIGAARRDYQLFVFDCPPITPPDPTITINDQPATEVTACQGGIIVLKATVNSNWGYQWKRNGDNLEGATSPTLNVTEGGTYQLVTYLEDRCSKTRRSRKVKIDFTTSNFKLKANGRPRICATGGGNFTLESPANANYTYEWYLDGQRLSAAQALLTPTQAGRYWATVRDASKGCSSRSDTVQVQRVTPANISLSSSEGLQLCVGITTTLGIANGGSLKTYQWTRNGQVLPNENKASLAVSEAGDYKVAATDTNGCNLTAATINIKVVNKVMVTLDSVRNFCGTNFAAVPLIGTPTGGVYAGNGVANGQFDPKVAGVGTHEVVYSIKGALACQNGEAKRTVIITPPPVLDLGTDREIFKGSSVILNGDLGAGYRYQWSPPTALSQPLAGKTSASPESTTTYTLLAAGPDGCQALDTITVRVITTIYIPDVFTPNGDGQNDVWELRGLENYPNVEVTVWNRWGNVVFYGKGSNQKLFDGKNNDLALPNGVYAYYIKTNAEGSYVFRGAVMIMR